MIDLEFNWQFWGRENQFAPLGDWATWLILAGRGFGKTRTGAEWIKSRVDQGYKYIVLIGATAADVRDVMIQGESGLLSVFPPEQRPVYNPSNREVIFHTGAIAKTFSAEKPDSLRGPQGDTSWVDELCKFRYAQEAMDQLQFGLRLGDDPRMCITTTPKNIKILKDLIADNLTVTTKGTSYDNLNNLAPTFKDKIIGKYEGTRLGRQELNAELLIDNPNALWNLLNIDVNRIKKADKPDMKRICVAVDPSTTGNEKSDETGIVTIGESGQEFYVMDDASVGGRNPNEWVRIAIQQYYKHEADFIVYEANQGGDMVKTIIHNVDSTIKVVSVHATRGKYVRAEPIAGLYEQNKVHHIDYMPVLEDQMCAFDVTGLANGKSPDRVDALVWGITKLSEAPQSNPSIRAI